MYMVVGWFHFRANGEGQRCFMAYFSTDTKTSRLFGVYMTRSRGGGGSSPKAWAGCCGLEGGRPYVFQPGGNCATQNTTHSTQHTQQNKTHTTRNKHRSAHKAQPATHTTHNTHTHTQEFGLGARTKGATSSTLLDSTDIESCFPECACTW